MPQMGALLWALFAGVLFSACNVTKHLDTSKGERLLVSNALELKAERKLSFSERIPLSYLMEVLST